MLSDALSACHVESGSVTCAHVMSGWVHTLTKRPAPWPVAPCAAPFPHNEWHAHESEHEQESLQ